MIFKRLLTYTGIVVCSCRYNSLNNSSGQSYNIPFSVVLAVMKNMYRSLFCEPFNLRNVKLLLRVYYTVLLSVFQVKVLWYSRTVLGFCTSLYEGVLWSFLFYEFRKVNYALFKLTEVPLKQSYLICRCTYYFVMLNWEPESTFTIQLLN